MDDLEELKTIDVEKSSRIDDVSAKVLKDCLMGMSEHFRFILNLSLTSGIFPKSWKNGKISPIPKVCGWSQANFSPSNNRGNFGEIYTQASIYFLRRE